MSGRPLLKVVLLLVAASAAFPGAAEASSDPAADTEALLERIDQLMQGPRAKLLILGTFHFQDAGLDDYKPKHGVPVLSEERQAEVGEVVDALARFAPTRVAVEWPKEQQDRVDELYGQYRRGERELGANEVYQLGFRLAGRLDHERIHAVDVKGRHYEPRIDRGKEAKRLGLKRLMKSPWYAKYEELSRAEDLLKTRVTLRDYFLYLNSERRVTAGHGIYLVGGFRVAAGSEYPGPDHLSGWWYNRNLRIFANLLALVESPDDRIVLVVGAGHVPILRHAALATPEIELVTVEEILGSGR